MSQYLIHIGNSQGIRIPKTIIQQAGLQDAELVLQVVPEGLLISPINSTRHGWAKACEAMHANAEDKPLMSSVGSNQFDKEEWEW